MSFYVYTLIDPRDAAVFYVGKGKGLRAWHHEKAERRGVERNAIKAEKLGQIRRAGLRPIVTIVQDGLTEREAYRLERSMIVSRHAELTNIALGSRTAMECVLAATREDLARIKPLCVLLKERPSRERVAIWASVVSGLSRIAQKAA